MTMSSVHDMYQHQMMMQGTMLPPQGDISATPCEVTLQNGELWNQFHEVGTEMIITKSGRRMFPALRLGLSRLDPDALYCVLLELVPLGRSRYKFSGSRWECAGGAEPQSPLRAALHPDSPAAGRHWNGHPVLFNKVKLTNNTLDSNGHIVLTSMHRYQPVIHIVRASDPALTTLGAPSRQFSFPETQFVAVTAYQNDRITKLKIDNNPFAKGFRETGQSRCKRKSQSEHSTKTQPPPERRSSSPEDSGISSGSEENASCSNSPQHNYINPHQLCLPAPPPASMLPTYMTSFPTSHMLLPPIYHPHMPIDRLNSPQLVDLTMKKKKSSFTIRDILGDV